MRLGITVPGVIELAFKNILCSAPYERDNFFKADKSSNAEKEIRGAPTKPSESCGDVGLFQL